MGNKALNVRSQINNFLTIDAESKHRVNNTELKLPSLKVKSNQRALMRGITAGDSKDTLHVRTISGLMIAAIADLDPATATSTDLADALGAVKDSIGTTITSGSSFAPVTSMKNYIAALTVTLPDGTLVIDDVGKSPGFARPTGATSTKQALRQVIGTGGDILHVGTMSGTILKIIDSLPFGSSLGTLITTINSYLALTTTYAGAPSTSIAPSANIIDIVNSVIKADGFGSFVIDDVGNYDVTTKNKSKKIYDIIDSVVENVGGTFFLKTIGGEIMHALSLDSTPTVLEFTELI